MYCNSQSSLQFKVFVFSEESSRTIYELKHISEGLTFCSCGICLRLEEDRRNQANFQALIVPYYLARVNHSRGEKHGEALFTGVYIHACIQSVVVSVHIGERTDP